MKQIKRSLNLGVAWIVLNSFLYYENFSLIKNQALSKIYLIFSLKHFLSDSPILLIDSNLVIAFKNITIVANQEPNNSFII